MKTIAHFFTIVFFLFGSLNIFSQGVAINTDGTAAANSAMLDVSSTSMGILIPRMDIAQRNLIDSPATGLLIYQTDNTPGFYFYDGSAWVVVGNGATSINDLNDGLSDNNSLYMGADAGNLAGSNKYSTGVGVWSLKYVTTGASNTALGTSSLMSLTEGSNNTVIGANALPAITTTSNNTVLGTNAGQSVTGGGNILIGFDVAKAQINISNRLYIENSNSASPLIYGEFDNDLLRFNGTVELANGTSASSLKFYEPSGSGTNYTSFLSQAQAADVTYTLPVADGSNGQMLQTDGSGALSWSSDSGATDINGLSDGKTGGNSVFLGSGAGAVDDESDNKNVGIGIDALNKNTSGEINTAVGYNALYSSTIGESNTAIGSESLYNNTEGMYNNAIGGKSLYNNTVGDYNNAVGQDALSYNTIGNENTAIGDISLGFNTTGNQNTALGCYSLFGNKTGSQNTVVGAYAGMNSFSSISGSVFLGYQAGKIESNSNRLYIENSNSASPLIYGEFDNDLLKFNGTVELANGTSASSLKFYEPSGSGTNYTSFLSQAQAADVTYTLPVADGSNGQMLQTDGSGALSWSSDSGATDINGLSDGKTGGNSVFLGSGAGAVDDESDNKNVGIGIDALNKNTNGNNNIAIGGGSLWSNTTGSYNTAIGTESLFNNIDGEENLAIGKKSLYSNASGGANNAVGNESLYSNTIGVANTAMGHYSLYHNTTGEENTAFGVSSMEINTTGNYNVGIGAYANYFNQEGSNNTIVGYEAGSGSGYHNKSGNVFLGYQAGYNETSDNKLYIENSDSPTPLIYGEFDNDLLKFNGTVELANGTSASSLKFYEPSGSGTNYTSFLSQAQAADVTYTLPAAAGTNGQMLQTDGSGALSWTNDISGATNIDGLSDGKSDGTSVFLGSNSGNSDDGSNYNAGIGIDALNSNISGVNNAAIGHSALGQNTSGQYNTGVGRSALYANTEGSHNTVLGADAGTNCATTTSGCVLIGYQAGINVSSSNRLYIDNSSTGTPLIYGEFDNDLLKFNGTVELANGTSASSLKFYEPSGSGANYTRFLSQAQATDVIYTLPAAAGTNGQILKTDGSSILSWTNDISGVTNINGLSDGKSDGSSVFLGSNSGNSDNGSNSNTGLGIEALNSNISGEHNVAIGPHALHSNNASRNVAIGSYAMVNNTNGEYNTVVGMTALYSNTQGSQNTAIGFNAGSDCAATTSGCVLIGYEAGRTVSSSNRLYIENSSTVTPLIYGEFDNDLLKFNGTLELANGTSASSLKFYEPSGSGANYTRILSQAQAADVTYTLPAAAGTNGQMLQTDGSGALSWTNDISGATNIDGLSDGKSDGTSVFLGSNSGNSDDGSNYNASIGIEALNSNTSGVNNAAIGHSALGQNTSGQYNTGVGRSALYANTEGSQNTVLGADAGNNCATTTSGCVLIGYQAGINVSSSNRLYIENSSTSTPLIYGEFDNDLLKFNGTVELANGTSASSLKFYEPSGSGANYTSFLSQAQATDVIYTLPVAAGTNGQILKTDGSSILSWTNDISGATDINGLSDGKTEGNSVFLGSGAGAVDNGSNYNTGLGIEALYSNIGGVWNCAFGKEALKENTASQNSALGGAALSKNTSGHHNTAVGRAALNTNINGNENTAIGADAGFPDGITNFSNTAAFGYNTKTPASNYYKFGNSSVSSIGGQVGWSTYSDKRFKRNINENVQGLDFILKLRPVNYHWDIQKLDKFMGASEGVEKSETMREARRQQEAKVYTGFLAQEVEQAAMETGFDFSGVETPPNDKTPYSLRYAEFVVPLVKGMQEQQEMIKNLQQQNMELIERIEKLEGK